MSLHEFPSLSRLCVQRIENWWNQGWRDFAAYWRGLFLDLEAQKLLDLCVRRRVAQ